MLALQLYVPIAALPGVLSELTGQQGVGHVVQVGETAGGELVLITADVAAGVVDSLLPRLMTAGVPGDEIAVVHGESSRPFGSTNAARREPRTPSR